jgi:hypothetical protein
MSFILKSSFIIHSFIQHSASGLTGALKTTATTTTITKHNGLTHFTFALNSARQLHTCTANARLFLESAVDTGTRRAVTVPPPPPYRMRPTPAAPSWEGGGGDGNTKHGRASELAGGRCGGKFNHGRVRERFRDGRGEA